jgi:hypothetical protein
MHLNNALPPIAALVSSVLLFTKARPRVIAVVAVAAAAVETLLASGVVSFGVRGVNLTLILGACLLVAGAILWTRTAGKAAVTEATVVTLVGALQVAAALL